MSLARDPDVHDQAPPEPSRVIAARAARERRRQQDFAVLEADPRLVDQISTGVYKYHPVLRVMIFLGLASFLWAIILIFSFGLLSSIF